MHFDAPLKVIVLIAFCLVAFACGSMVYFAVNGNIPNVFLGSEFILKEKDILIEESNQSIFFASSHDIPVRILIPKIQVDTEIESVGVTSKGAMEIPEDPNNAGWFNLGVRPGERGSAVIDGHLNWKDGVSGVFEKLATLEKGDRIFIEDRQGKIVVFLVTNTRIYDANADTTGVFTSNDGKSHLNLITCDGLWDPYVSSYSKRLVVFTEKE